MPVDWNDAAVIARVRAGAARGVARSQEVVKDRAQQLIADPPKTGRIYRRRGVEHQASAPGEAPATDQGHLAGNITTDPIDMSTITGTVTARSEYAEALEKGTPRIEPRPFMRRALEEKRKEIETLIDAEISAALR